MEHVEVPVNIDKVSVIASFFHDFECFTSAIDQSNYINVQSVHQLFSDAFTCIQ